MKQVTGPGVTTSVAMELADLGIARYDPQRNALALMFGDNFSFSWGQDWQSPSIVMYDDGLNVLGVPTATGIATQPRRQLWPYGHNNPDYSTVLPCDFIRIGDLWHVAVMLTQGLGHETVTEFWQSPDLIGWWRGDPFVQLHHPGHPGNTMLTFERFGNHVYICGTGGLARDRGIWLWRNPADQFPHGRWEPYGRDRDGWAWGTPNEDTPILEGRYGELCLREVDGRAVLSVFDAGRYCQTAFAAPTPDQLTDPHTRTDYATGDTIPQLYGGYIVPGSHLDTTNGMRFLVSQWNTQTNDPYRVLLVDGTLPAPQEAPMPATTAVEKVLPYDHDTSRVRQERGWDCGPASVQIVLQALGVEMSETDLIRELGTDEEGTDTVEQALPVLNRVTRGRYVAVWMPNDPPTADQQETLWRNVTASIDAGYGVVFNFEVPSSNFPRGTRGSVSPSYGGNKIWHYVACMGYAEDSPGDRHFWIADPGFPPNGYWMSAYQAGTAIPPHAYAHATATAAPVPAPPRPVEAPPGGDLAAITAKQIGMYRLTDRPRHPSQDDDQLGHIMSARAEQLYTQAMVAAIAERFGVDIEEIRRAVQESLR